MKSVRIQSFSGPYIPEVGLNTDQKNSEYGHFSHSDLYKLLPEFQKDFFICLQCSFAFSAGKFGGHIKGTHGNIKCFGSIVCHFLIQVSQGKKVQIEFATFNIGDQDKVEVYDGEKFEPFVTFTKRLIPKPVTSNDYLMRIITNGFVSINYRETSECGCRGLGAKLCVVFILF